MRESGHAAGTGSGEPVLAIGIMTGTSMDGVDVAMLETDGEARLAVRGGLSRPFDAVTRTSLRDAVARARTARRADPPDGVIQEAERLLTRAAAAAVSDLIAEHDLSAGDVAVLGFHGQTILHAPQDAFTWQLGNAALLAELTGCDVVHDFRSADMAAGGQGAPFAPVYHRARALSSGERLPLAVLNIGGVSNVTWIGPGESILAFDTGPGNALIDDWMSAMAGEAFDRDGRTAATGTVRHDVLTTMLDNTFFDNPPPKSLDRNDFDLGPVRGLDLADGAATLTMMTVEAIELGARFFPAPVSRWIVSGGGARNAHLMSLLRDHLATPVVDADACGWSATYMEAEAFAYLAVRSMRGLPLSFPGTTGVAEPTTGGRLVPARGRAA